MTTETLTPTPEWVIKMANDASKLAFKGAAPIMERIPDRFSAQGAVYLAQSFLENTLMAVRALSDKETALKICDAIHQDTREALIRRPSLDQGGPVND